MTFKSIFATLTIQLVALSSAFVFSLAHADDYRDVTQLTKDGKYAEAIAKADAHILTKPRDPQMRFLKGVAQRDAGKTVEAIATFTRLTEDYPELPEPYNNLGVLYASQNQIDKARSAFEMAIRTNPTYSTAHENLGDVYAKLSSNAYNKALQLEGNNAALTPKLALIRQLVNPNTNPLKIVPAAPVPSAAAAAAPRTPGAAAPVPAPASPAAAPVPPPAAAPAPVAPAAAKTPEPAVQTPASKPSNDSVATKEAEAGWMDLVRTLSQRTLLTKAKTWYVGANVSGKPQGLTLFTGGFLKYRELCAAAVQDNYRGFMFEPTQAR